MELHGLGEYAPSDGSFHKDLTHHERKRKEVSTGDKQNYTAFVWIVENVGRREQSVGGLGPIGRRSCQECTAPSPGPAAEFEVEFPVGFRRSFLPREDAAKSDEFLRVGLEQRTVAGMVRDSFRQGPVDMKQSTDNPGSKTMRAVFHT